METIKLNCVYPKTIDVVWAYFIHEDLLNKWCMPTRGFSLQTGKVFSFEGSQRAYWKDKFINTITGFNVCNSLSYRFECEKIKLDTNVKWLFEEINGNTKVSLEHGGFKLKDFFTRLYIKRGWKKMLYGSLRGKLA